MTESMPVRYKVSNLRCRKRSLPELWAEPPLPPSRCAILLLFFFAGAIAAFAQEAQPGESKLTFVGGQLTIETGGSNLAEILKKVAALTGAKIDLAENINAVRLPAGRSGPGPARQVLASLLSDASVDYAILGSDSDVSVQTIFVFGRDNRPNSGSGDGAGRGVPGAHVSGALAAAAAEEIAPNPAAAESSQSAPQAAPAGAPDTDPTPPPPARAKQVNSPQVSPVTPPASLTSQTITDQLQQMYQQRAKMTQQERQTGSSLTPGPVAK
jgi:hypothetical protein